MRTLILLVVLSGAAAAAAEEQPQGKSTDELVKAAKAAREKRKTSTTKVITNADVAKSKGKLIVIGPSASKQGAATKEPAVPVDIETLRRDKVVAAARVKLQERRVAELEKELETVEHSYYDEDDLEYRDSVIVRRFELAKAQLDEAKKHLEAARDAVRNP